MIIPEGKEINYSGFIAHLESLFAGHFPHHIAIAVSGGADSMCLSYLCGKWAAEKNIQITCLIVDHRLRPESTSEATTVKHRLESKGLPTEILIWESKKPKSNIHAIARAMRYNLLTNYCKRSKIEHLLTAHTKNDQAETVILRIFRGTGIDGLAGIPAVTKINGVNILRPMLGSIRKEIEATLLKENWQWVNDPSNFNEKYDRVKIRNLIASLPDKDLIISRLNLLADNSLRTKNFLDKVSAQSYHHIIREDKFGKLTLNLKNFLNLDIEIAFRVLAQALKRVSGNYYPPRLESLQLIYNNLNAVPRFTKTLSGCEIQKCKEVAYIYREFNATESNKELIPERDTIWDNRYLITIQGSNLFIGALGTEGLRIIKTRSKDKIAPAKILYGTPAIFNRYNELMFYPILNIGDPSVKLLRFERLNNNKETLHMDLL